MTPEKRMRTKSVTELVLEELSHRTEKLLKDPPRELVEKTLYRSKSFAANVLEKKSKFDDAHLKQFKRYQ